MTTTRLLLTLIALLLAVAACGDSEALETGPSGSGSDGSGADDPAPGNDGAEPTLDGRTFWSVAVTENGEPRDLVDGTIIRIGFDGDTISASAGCNSIGGGFTVSDGVLDVGDLFMTEIGCDPERHDQDEFAITFLTSRPTLSLADDTLRLVGDEITIEFLDREVADPDRPVVGTRWTATGFLQGETAMAMAVDQPGWIELADDSTMAGFDGCVEFTAPVEYSDGSIGGPVAADGEVQFGPRDPEPPTEGCANPDYVEAFNALFATGEATITVEGPNLTALNRDGHGVTFRADG